MTLGRRDNRTGESVILRSFRVAPPLAMGADVELELRAVGSTLSVILNGQLLGTVEDATYAEGPSGVASTDAKSQRAILRSLEVLNLDSAASASAAPVPWRDSTLACGLRSANLSPMTKDEQRAILKQMLAGYEYLEEERRERVRQADTAGSLAALGDLFDSAVWLHPPNPSSGLVEQQAIFARARR